MRHFEQVNFVMESVEEFIKLWKSRQKANINLACNDGEISVNFMTSMKPPKKSSPSRLKRNDERSSNYHANQSERDKNVSYKLKFEEEGEY